MIKNIECYISFNCEISAKFVQLKTLYYILAVWYGQISPALVWMQKTGHNKTNGGGDKSPKLDTQRGCGMVEELAEA